MSKIKNKIVQVTLLLGVLVVAMFLFSKSEDTEEILNEAQAIVKAQEAWINIFEKSQNPCFSSESTKKFEPYKAVKINDKWVVKGTLMEGQQGEVVEAEITIDGKVSVSCRLMKND